MCEIAYCYYPSVLAALCNSQHDDELATCFVVKQRTALAALKTNPQQKKSSTIATSLFLHLLPLEMHANISNSNSFHAATTSWPGAFLQFPRLFSGSFFLSIRSLAFELFSRKKIIQIKLLFLFNENLSTIP